MYSNYTNIRSRGQKLHLSRGTQRVQDDGDINAFLQDRASDGRDVAKRGKEHTDDGKTDAPQDAFFCDARGIFCDEENVVNAPDVAAEDCHRCRFNRRAILGAGEHDAHIRERERRCVVQPVAHHHHLAAFRLRGFDDGKFVFRKADARGS